MASPADNPRRKWLIAGMAVGGLLTLSPLWGMLGTVIGMMLAFRSLGETGVANPEELSGAVGVSMVSTAAGIVLCPIGLALLIPCVVLCIRDRKQSPPPLPR